AVDGCSDRKFAKLHRYFPGCQNHGFVLDAAGTCIKCTFCREGDFAVIDSRNNQGGFPVRRRRACDHCKRRAWTVEQIVEVPLQVVKKDETREPYNADKLRRGLEKACYKRPVSAEQIDA